MNLAFALSAMALLGSILWLDNVLPCNTWGCLIRMAALLFGPIGVINALAYLEAL